MKKINICSPTRHGIDKVSSIFVDYQRMSKNVRVFFFKKFLKSSAWKMFLRYWSFIINDIFIAIIS